MKRVLITIGLITTGFSLAAQDSGLILNKQAPPIELLQPDGKLLKLTDYEGGLVLLDFWATWCEPCVQEQPVLKKIYEKHQQSVRQGKFQVIGVSLDRSKMNWTTGISNLAITWPQASDLKYWNSPVARQYHIEELPYNVLIDERGKVIAVNLHGRELESFIDSHLNKAS
ncbi:TlpA disulfide reductase family protein [Paraflavitalea sp. CAU 1676]|uniref:TlpA family protein disulfide reductase n=1 Tax=Paraflavitalea sp. CAU 1676 TaxID=3032598 RepID=UPI0023DADBB6|nr:TlpA disulfide reductase family protein [Paraflavitalea sp. CAU 1676]MDF2191308.1 TlpA disulfide reductase family protein [Paraflavitalea sp. CAU 1676]